MKYIVSFFSLLVLLISGVLFFQYQVYSDHRESKIDDFTYTQEIDIVYRGQSLDIRHHFRNLPNQTISINWPEQAVNPDCFIESENSCKRLSEDFSKFQESDMTTQSISYIIPLDGGLKPNQLMKDIFVTLENGIVSYSTVHITTEQSIAGTWVTGLPLVGQQSLSLVHYSMFSGTGPVKELYYANHLQLQREHDLISIYSTNNIGNELVEQLNKVNFLNDEHVAIVHGSNLSGKQGERILFSNSLSIEALKKEVILSQLRTKFQFENVPAWVTEVVASFLSDTEIGGEKAKEITMTLKSRLTAEQLELWKQKLHGLEGKKIDAALLDEQLSEVFANHTQYFQSNVSTDGVYPLLFNDLRDVYVNAHLVDDIEVIFKDGQVLYSADSLLHHLGYETRVGEKGYYVNSDIRQYRFPFNHKFYVYNQRRYNTVSQPIKVIAGKYYIEESWVQKLFFVEMDKKKDSISIKTIDSEQQS